MNTERQDPDEIKAILKHTSDERLEEIIDEGRDKMQKYREALEHLEEWLPAYQKVLDRRREDQESKTTSS